MRTLGLAIAALALACKSSGTKSPNVATAPGASSSSVAASDKAPAGTIAADYYPYSKPGTATIEGQAFVVVQGGDVILDTKGYLTTLSDNTRTASGSEVTLDPATSFAMDWYMKSGTSLRRFANAPKDPAFRAARRTAVADESGRFTFANLPAGRYIVRTTITWKTPRDSYRMMVQGGVASAVVDLAEGERKALILKHVSDQP